MVPVVVVFVLVISCVLIIIIVGIVIVKRRQSGKYTVLWFGFVIGDMYSVMSPASVTSFSLMMI